MCALAGDYVHVTPDQRGERLTMERHGDCVR